jgi:hypothetical protein
LEVANFALENGEGDLGVSGLKIAETVEVERAATKHRSKAYGRVKSFAHQLCSARTRVAKDAETFGLKLVLKLLSS